MSRTSENPFMAPPSRRTILRSGLSVLSLSLAGCITSSRRSGPPNESPTSTADLTETSEPSPTPTATSSPDDVEPTATVLTEPSTESPPQVALSLRNTGTNSVSVAPFDRGIYPLEFLQPLSGDEGDVLLFPPETPSVELMQGEIPEEPVDGCWRVVDTSASGERGPYLAGNNLSKTVEIAPNETYTVPHNLYYRGPDNVCFSPGEYQTTSTITLGSNGSGPRLDVTYTLSITSAGTYNVTGRMQ